MKGNRSDGADSTVTATSSRSLIFWDHGDKRKAGGAGFVTMETSSVDELSRCINPRKKQWSMEGSSLYLSFWNVFLKFRFWVICWIFFTVLISKLEVQSHRKKNVYVSSFTKDEKKKKKGIAYLHQEVLGRLFFSGSPHSLHTRVSHGSVFSWHD